MSDTRTDLPSVKAPNFEQRVREVLMTYLGRQGNPLDRGLTLRDLIENGIVALKAGYTLRPGAGTLPLDPGTAVQPDYEPDLTPPPTPTGFAVNSAISHVFIEHDAPTYQQGHGHLRTRVYGVTYTSGPLPTFDDAIEITQFTGTIHAHPSNPSTTWRLWIKWETNDGVLSPTPAGGTNGLAVTTGQDVQLLLDALTGQIRESQLFADLGSRINLIDGPAALSGSVAQRIATEAETRASETGDLFAKYTVKIDTNGYVSGFGLASTANNATPSSEFIVRADNFAIASPSGPGISPAEPFFVRTTETTIGGVTVPVGVYMQDAFIQNGTITNAKIANLAVDNAKIASLSADKVAFGEMSGQRIATNSLDANRITTSTLLASTSITANAGTGTSVLISGEGFIDVDGPSKRTKMTEGNVITYLKVPSVGEIPYQSLTHVEVGTCQNNTEVTIPGYFATQPKVLVSPAELGVYNKDYAAQSQTLICTPGAVTQTGANTYRWKFTPTATLSLLGTEQNIAINANSGITSGDTNTTATRQAPGNTDRITVDMQFLSVRGTGTNPNYNFRQVAWYIQYSTDQVSWTNGPTTTVQMGANISSYVASSQTVTFPSPQAWYWRVVSTASDAGGTFSMGGATYNYHTDTVGGTVGSASVYVDGATATSASQDVNITMNSYSPPAGYSIYQVDYSYSINYSLWATSGAFNHVGTAFFRNEGNGTFDSISSDNQNDRSKTGTYSRSFSQASYSTSFKGGNCYVTRTNGAAARSQTTGGSISATVYSRQLITNSTTPENQFNLIARNVRIVGAQVLATGTLNWMAVGA